MAAAKKNVAPASASKKATLSSLEVLAKLQNENVDLKPTQKKSEANKEKWELPLDNDSTETATQWVSAKTIWDIVNARMTNTKDQFCSYALEKMAEKIFSMRCHPGNPNVILRGDKGKEDHKFILVMQDNFKVEVPKNFPDGVNQVDWMKDHFKALLQDVGLSEDNASSLVENELEVFPVTGIRSLTELLDGHYGEKRVWLDSTQEEKEAGTRLAALLMWDGSSTPEPLSPSDKSLIVRRDTTVTVKSDFYSRVALYCEDAEQLKGVFTVVKPVTFPSYSKFAINDNESDRLKRKMKAAVDIMQKHEYEIGERYGRVIRTRCDLMHNGINFDDVENKILIDSSNVFPNDCFFMTNRNAAVKIAEFMMEEFFDPKYEDSAERPPHQMFLNAIKHNNLDVDVQKVMQCVVRQNQIQYY